MNKYSDFINRYQWNMTKTGSGLRFLIYKKGNGEKAEVGKKVGDKLAKDGLITDAYIFIRKCMTKRIYYWQE